MKRQALMCPKCGERLFTDERRTDGYYCGMCDDWFHPSARFRKILIPVVAAALCWAVILFVLDRWAVSIIDRVIRAFGG